jgi:LysR family transcriptional regulator, nitrogen assimilation regulatory protein
MDRKDMIGIRKLRYFTAVAERGSFTKAAASLGVAQPALSRQVQQLEQEIGLQLFVRLGRQLRLTDAGEAMLKHAKTVERDFERLREDMQARRSTPMGRVVVGIPPTLADTVAPLAASQVQAQYPSIALSIVDGLTPVLTEWLHSNRVDLAILSYPVMPAAHEVPGLRVEPLASEDMVVVERAQATLGPRVYTLDQLRRKAFVLSKMLAAIVRHHLDQPDFEFRCIMEIDAVHTIRSLVLTGQAASILPMAMLSEDVCQGRLTASAITECGIRRQLILAQTSLRQMTQASEAVSRILKQVIAQMNAKGAFALTAPSAAMAGPACLC